LPIADWKGAEVTPDELKMRTKQFALRVLKLVDALPNSKSGRIISGQLGRAGTSVGANYRAACRARSKKEFVAKIGIVEEEADECEYWLELTIESNVLREAKVRPLHQEAFELRRIMAASAKSARAALARQTRLNRQSAIGNRQST
jgi:four helix bundle protein